MSAAFGSIAVGIFAHHYRKAHLPFGMIVISGHIGMQKENEQFLAVLGQTLCQPFAVLIAMGAAKDVGQAQMEIGNPSLIGWLSQLFAIDDQLQGFVHQAFQPSGKKLPLAGVIAQRDLLDLAQQMDDTLLLGERLDAIVGAEKVGDQDPLEKSAEDLLDDRAGSGRCQDIVGQGLVRKAPEPGQPASDAPAALVGVEHRREPCGLAQALIDRHEKFGQSLPIQHQPAGCDLKLAESSKPGTDVAGCHAEGVVQVRRQQRQPQAQRGPGQCRRHGRFHLGSTRGAVVFKEDMLGNFGLDGRDVLDDLAVFAAGFTDGIMANRALGELVLYDPIDVRGSRAVGARVSILAAGFAAPFRNRWLAVGRLHGRGGRKRTRLVSLGCFGFEFSLEPGVFLLQLGDSLFIPAEISLVLGGSLLRLSQLTPQPLHLTLKPVDFFSLSFEKSGEATMVSTIAGEAKKYFRPGLPPSPFDMHPPYDEARMEICPEKSNSIG